MSGRQQRRVAKRFSIKKILEMGDAAYGSGKARMAASRRAG
jgi:hypothetical protein